MDYTKLIEPYLENGRTLEGQIAWLVKKGIPKSNIDQAIISIYDEMDRGKVYASGHELDRALFDRATELMKSDAAVGLRQLEVFHDTLRQKWGEDLQKMVMLPIVKKTPLWKKILSLGLIK